MKKVLIVDDEKVNQNLDSTDDCFYLNSINKKEGKMVSKNRIKSAAYFDDVAYKAKELIIDACKNILNNDFKINPKRIKLTDKSCTYCPFKDICYKL